MTSEYFSRWSPEVGLLVTRLTGEADLKTITAWNASLHLALAEIPDGADFRILVDIHGFKAANIEAHKAFRVVVPEALAAYGWRAGYLGLFPEVELMVKLTRGIRCIAAAHVHQDETKIALYEQRFATCNERFFTDRAEGERWVRALPRARRA
ncbi:MAG: hypothetical protein EOO15_09110 [Chitinophagaceae bacterium]|nr:MAG: hypothetical protein EOO15_09110 [Chitinophagaceae bacterium]